MWTYSKGVVAGLAAGLVFGSSVAGPAAAGDVSGDAGGAARPVVDRRSGPDVEQTVTLLTGDRVVIPGGDVSRARVDPGAGRDDVPFQIRRVGERLHVTPADVTPLLVSGSLDRRLFDVSGLLAAGYDDASRDDIPLIVTSGDAPRAATGATLADAGATVTRQLPAVDGAAARVDKDEATEFWSSLVPDVRSNAAPSGVERIWLDGVRRQLLDQSTVQVGAPTAWEAGLTGAGVTVGVVDGGIDATHPDLADRIVAARNFTDGDDGDTDGHGTHIASTIAGTGAASGGRYRGIAHEAGLLDAKVCYYDDDRGRDLCPESSILAGMQWAAVDQGAKVVNLSLGAPDRPEVDLLEDAVERLTEQTGALFVVAAGNDGELGAGTVNSPASADAALAVGAVDRVDEIPDFSSRGPRVGDGGLKPDLTAPGVGIVAARARDAVYDPVDEHYARATGTSMSAPHVAGAAALVAQRYPKWTAEQLKAALMGSAVPHEEWAAYDQGAGRLDIAAAINLTVLTEPASLSFGVARWPHDDDRPIDKALTYRNISDEPVTLDLSVEATGPDGEPAPTGMFDLGDTELDVPAGGTATTTLTADTRLEGPDGRYSGRVVASADGISVGTPFAVDREVESYDLTLTDLDPHGDYSIWSHDDENVVWWVDSPDAADGEATLRLPRGRYYIHSWIVGPTSRNDVDVAVLPYPLLDLTEPTTIALDVRAARSASVSVPRESALLQFAEVGYDLQIEPDAQWFNIGIAGDDFESFAVGHLGPTLRPDQLEGWVAGNWAEPGDEGTVQPGRYPYALAWFEPGRVPTGFERQVRDHDLATVRRHVATEGPGQTGFADLVAVGPTRRAEVYVSSLAMNLPATFGVHHNTDGARWRTQIFQWPNQRQLWSEPTIYRAGRSHYERWNTAVFGPGLPPSGAFTANTPVTRLGDTILADIPLQSDGAGHGGFSWSGAPARTALFADGELVGETNMPGIGEFEVPARRTSYRLETELTRFEDESQLSTQVSATWTFQSEHVPDSKQQTLPLSVVRFIPDVDEHNRVRSGPVVAVPVTIDAQPGTPNVPANGLSVEVSHDDGDTWEKTKLVPAGAGNWRALIHHEETAEFVSLRAKATDREGNTVEQTIIRAYQLGRVS